MIDVIKISELIQAKNKELDDIRKVLIERSNARDEAEKEYNKKYAVVLIQLKNKVEFEFEGIKIKEPPAASVKEIAKGICFNEKFNLDKAESMLKIAYKNIETCIAQQTANQSLLKYME